MKDEEILVGLRDAARRADAATTGEPLGDAYEADIAAKILALPMPQASTPPKPAPRVRSIARPVFAALAVAAGVALAITRPWVAAAEPLPAYALVATGGDESQRAIDAPPTAMVAHPDSVLTIDLRPTVDVAGPLAVHVVALRGGHAAPVTAGARVSASGGVEVTGAARDLVGPEPGPASVVVVVAREGVNVDARAVALGGPAPRGAFSARVDLTISR